MTIDEAIVKLCQCRTKSPLGGNTVLVLSLSNSGIETQEFDELSLVEDDDGAVVELRCHIPFLPYLLQ